MVYDWKSVSPTYLSSDGFNEVFPMEKLHIFSPAELGRMLCGEQAPKWTKDDVINYTEPKLGYSRERYVYWNQAVGFFKDEHRAT